MNESGGVAQRMYPLDEFSAPAPNSSLLLHVTYKWCVDQGYHSSSNFNDENDQDNWEELGREWEKKRTVSDFSLCKASTQN